MNEWALSVTIFLVLACNFHYNGELILPVNLFMSAFLASFLYGFLILQRRIQAAYGQKDEAQVKYEAMVDFMDWIFSNITTISLGFSFFTFFTILVAKKAELYVNILISTTVFFGFYACLSTQASMLK